MQVSKIKYEIHSIDYNNTKFKKLLDNNKHLFPNKLHKSISFNLLNSSTEFANAIRRVVTNELQIKILKVNINDIVTDDKFILPNLIKDRIESIPLDQNVSDSLKFKLNVYNNTLEFKNIKTKNIKIINNKEDISKLINLNMILCYLNSNKNLTVSNITVDKNTGFHNGKYALCNVQYEIINTDFKSPTLSIDSNDFSFKFITNGNIDPVQIIHKTVINLTERLTILKKNIKEFNNIYKEIEHKLVNTNDLYIIKNYNIYSYYINNETHTIGNLLVKYIYTLVPSIELVNYTIIHPSKNQVIINIKHNEHRKLILNSIELILEDLKLFDSQF